jgi:alginate O-acetyltransferase complex protein AlgJ
MATLSRSTFVRSAGALALGAAGIAPARADETVNNVLIEGDRWLLPAWQSLTVEDVPGTNTTLDLIAETGKILAGGGIGLLVASIPFKARYCPALAPGALSAAVSARYARTQQALASRGLQTVDLAAALQPLVTAGQPVYYHTDQHWTTPAAEAAGAAVAAAIEQQWKLPAAVRSAPPAPLVVTKRVGDLAALLPAARRDQIGPETFELRTPYDADMQGYDLFTGQTMPIPQQGLVQLVGSSFVRPMWGMPQKMTAILGPDVGVTFFTGDAGPYHTLLMNLHTSVTKQRPTVIVWQLGEAQMHLGPSATDSWSMSSLMSADFFLSKVTAAVK